MTEVVRLQSGHEQRNQVWEDPLGRWRVDLENKSQALIAEYIAFARAIAKGRAIGFRFRDPHDHAVSSSQGVLVSLGGNEHQLAKRYSSGASSVTRPIRKPSAATLYQGAAPLEAGAAYELDSATGIVTTIGSPSPLPDSWEGEFHVPVRFDLDRMSMRATDRNTVRGLISTWGHIELVEIR